MNVFFRNLEIIFKRAVFECYKWEYNKKPSTILRTLGCMVIWNEIKKHVC